MKAQNEQAFYQSSELERAKMMQLFSKYGVTEYEFTSATGVERHDGIFTGAKSDVIFEVKVRNVSSTKYRTTIIEKSKLDYLLRKGKELNRVPIIFIFFTDGTVLMQKLFENINYPISKMNCPKTTAGGKSGYITKETIEFPITNENLIKL